MNVESSLSARAPKPSGARVRVRYGLPIVIFAALALVLGWALECRPSSRSRVKGPVPNPACV